MESAKIAKNKKLACHDCGKKINVFGDKIKDGVMLVYDDGGEKIKIAKCGSCFKKNQALVNFKHCEVYSRIVGYLRPVSQWNLGKKQEYKEREEFKAAMG